MPINKSREDLPRSNGFPPTTEPVIIEKFAERWLSDLLAGGYDEYGLAVPDAGPYRASWASKRCDRALQYLMRGEPKTNPPTFAGFWVMKLGSDVHKTMSDTLRSMGDGWIPDINIDLNTIGIPGSAHADLVRFVDKDGEPYELLSWWMEHDDDGNNIGMVYVYSADSGMHPVTLRDGEYDPTVMFPTHCAEVKSINGFAYKQLASSQNGPPEGPRTGAIIQGAMSAAALGLDETIIVNVSMEAAAERYVRNDLERVLAEWHITGVQRIGAYEAGRVRRIVGAGDTLVARGLHDQPAVPGGAIITHPRTGKWELRIGDEVTQFGNTWHCGYCNHRELCLADGNGQGQEPSDNLEAQLAASLNTQETQQ